MAETAEVAIVGGGPAGSALAIRLGQSGVSTVLFERNVEPKWRACGVFSSPLTRRRLTDLGMSVEEVAALHRPIAALALETTSGAECRLEYEHGYACGFDRVRLDTALLARARDAGVDVRAGAVVRSLELDAEPGSRLPQTQKLLVSRTDEDEPAVEWRARLVVGADGPGSMVARAAGVAVDTPWLRHGAITFHRDDHDAAPERQPMDGRFLLGDGWYVGVAPVPVRRVNVGIVVPDSLLARPLNEVIASTLGAFPASAGRWRTSATTDRAAVALPLAHRVSRVHGPGFVMVGDACGFVDPLTGEGLHRALVSSELAAAGITARLRGASNALEEYDRRLRARFRNKDLVSWLLQAFLAQPALLEYALRRLGRRAGLRRTFTLVMTDQLAASRALEPRYLLRLLRP